MKSVFSSSHIFIVLLCCFLAFPLLNVSAQAEERGGYLTADAMKGFADNLFDRGHFYRATIEYKRFLFYHPAHLYAPQAQFNLATAAQLAKDYASALDNYRAFLSQFPHHALAKKASCSIAEIESTLAGQ